MNKQFVIFADKWLHQYWQFDEYKEEIRKIFQCSRTVCDKVIDVSSREFGYFCRFFFEIIVQLRNYPSSHKLCVHIRVENFFPLGAETDKNFTEKAIDFLGKNQQEVFFDFMRKEIEKKIYSFSINPIQQKKRRLYFSPIMQLLFIHCITIPRYAHSVNC